MTDELGLGGGKRGGVGGEVKGNQIDEKEEPEKGVAVREQGM